MREDVIVSLKNIQLPQPKLTHLGICTLDYCSVAKQLKFNAKGQNTNLIILISNNLNIKTNK